MPETAKAGDEATQEAEVAVGAAAEAGAEAAGVGAEADTEDTEDTTASEDTPLRGRPQGQDLDLGQEQDQKEIKKETIVIVQAKKVKKMRRVIIKPKLKKTTKIIKRL